MTTKRYCKSGDYWYDLDSGVIEGQNRVHSESKRRVATTNYIPDVTPYLSPLGTGLVTSRSQRREEFKRHNCRETDPSEWKTGYTNERFARKHGLKLHGES